MRLLRVSHERCAEPRAVTYVCCPEAWTRAEVLAAVGRAQEAYLAFLRAWRDEPAPGGMTAFARPDFDKADPATPVGTVIAEFNARKAAYERWQAGRDDAQREFLDYLRLEGFVAPWRVEGEDWQVTLDWGHNHGLGIGYGAQEADLPGPLRRAAEDL